jgi:hypothetical protein
MNISEKSTVIGKTERRLFDTALYNKAVEAMESGQYSDEEVKAMFDKASKPMFAHNKLWTFIKNLFDIDIKIPFVTGIWTRNAIVGNLVTTRGKQIVAEQTNGETTAPVTAIAIGTGTTAAAAGDTALETEITTGGGSRGAATTSNETTTTTNDTAQWVKTFTFTSSFAVTEEGLFDNNTSGGNMLARQVFSAVNVVNTDTLQITHKVQVT